MYHSDGLVSCHPRKGAKMLWRVKLLHGIKCNTFYLRHFFYFILIGIKGQKLKKARMQEGVLTGDYSNSLSQESTFLQLA